MPLRCDATTSSGDACRRWAIGQIDGRNYCSLAAHKAQVEAASTAATAAEAPERAEPLTEDPSIEAAYPQLCPTCGFYHRIPQGACLRCGGTIPRL